MSPTICLSKENAKVEKGDNSDKTNQICFFSKVNQVIYSSSQIRSSSFKSLARTLFENLFHKISLKVAELADKKKITEAPFLFLTDFSKFLFRYM